MQSSFFNGFIGRFALSITVVIHFRYLEPRCQFAYNPNKTIDISQFMPPWNGPGAAIFNPALLFEADRFDARLAFHESVSGKIGTDFYQGAVRVYGGLFAGIAYFSNGAATDGSNAVYERYIRTPMIAYGRDSISGSGYCLGAEMNLAHDAFLSEKDEGRGYL